jgi:hypothetical protein
MLDGKIEFAPMLTVTNEIPVQNWAT